MAIEFNVDSQVRPYANVGAFPATGSVKTLYIDESTSDLYYWDGSAYAIVKSQSKYEAIDAINGTGATVLKMSVCYLKTSSSSANTPELLLSNASTEATSSKTIGLLLQDLANGATGKIITSGEYDKFDTSAYNVGDRLWLSTTDGQVTTTIPSAPTHAVFIGFVTRKQSQNGRILVSIQNGYELREIHDVSLPTTPLDGQVLAYDSPTSLWKAKTISTGITIGTTAITSGTVGRVLFEGTGNVVQESANLFWDNTNGRLGIGTSSPTNDFEIAKNSATPLVLRTRNLNTTTENRISIANDLDEVANFSIFSSLNVNTTLRSKVFLTSTALNGFGFSLFSNSATANFSVLTTTSLTERFRIVGSTGNVLINTTTDAGFKLDVNGTARVVNQATIQTLTIGLGSGSVATNTALGNRSLEANTTGGGNTGVGYITLLRTTTGSSNVALGSSVLQANITGSNNVGVGFNALRLITANHNVGVGTEVLSATTTGQANTAIGNYALNIQTTGSNNVGLGYNTQSGNFSGCVIIGKDAVATANNQFVVGSTGTVAGAVTTEVNASTQVWNVVINGVARKILLA